MVSAYKLFMDFLRAFGGGYRKRIAGLFALLVFSGLVEVAGVALVFPLIAIIADASLVETNRYLAWVYAALGFESVRGLVLTLAALVGGIFVLKNLYMIYVQRYQLMIIQDWSRDLGAAVMQKYLGAPYLYHLRRSSADMVNVLTQTINFSLNGFVLGALMALSSLIVAVMLVAFIMCKFLVPSLFAGGVMVLLVLTQARLLRRLSAETSAKINQAYADKLAVITQAIDGVKETKAFGRERYFLERYAQANAAALSCDRKGQFLQALPGYLNEVGMVFAVIIMACTMMFLTDSAAVGLANLAVLAAATFRLAPMLSRGLYSYSRMQVNMGPAQTLYDEMRALSAIDSEGDEASSDATALSFMRSVAIRGGDFAYDPARPVLTGIDVDIRKGEFVGIVGASGAGKTTLVDVIMGLLPLDHGQVAVDDTVIGLDNLRALRGMTGYVSQNPYIINGTLRENVAFGVAADEIVDDQVIKALEMAQLDRVFKARGENSLYSPIGDGGKWLSGGQKQRVAIARALYCDPEIIVLDEATSALDVETEHEVTQAMNSLKGKKTIIAIAHRLSTLKECDRIIYMVDGRIADAGTFGDLEARHPHFARLLALSSVKS